MKVQANFFVPHLMTDICIKATKECYFTIELKYCLLN
jgi:hypothetical protein